VIGVVVFIGVGIAAFFKLNIEAYPNPAPVIIEITAQSPGLSAEEMEKYYTIPMGNWRFIRFLKLQIFDQHHFMVSPGCKSPFPIM